MTTKNIILQITTKFFNNLNINLRPTQAATDTYSTFEYHEIIFSARQILKQCLEAKNNESSANELFNFEKSNIFNFNFEQLAKQAGFLLIPLCEISSDSRADNINLEEILTDNILININKTKAIINNVEEPTEDSFKSTGNFNPVKFRSKTHGFFDNSGLIDSVAINGIFGDIFNNSVNFFIKKFPRPFYLYALLEFKTMFSNPRYFYTMEKVGNEFKINKNEYFNKTSQKYNKESIDTIEIKFTRTFFTKTFRISDLNNNDFVLKFDPVFNTSNFNVKLSFLDDRRIAVKNYFLYPSTVVNAQYALVLKPEYPEMYKNYQELVKITKENNINKEKIKSMEKELNSTKNNLNSMKSKLESVENDHDNTKILLQNKINDLENDHDSTKNDLKNKVNELYNLNIELDRTKYKLSETKNELDSTKNELHMKKNDFYSMENKLLNCEIKLKNKENELNSIKEQIKEQDESNKQKAEFSSFKTNIESLENRNQNLADSRPLLDKVKAFEAEARKAKENADLEKAKSAVGKSETIRQKIKYDLETGNSLNNEIESLRDKLFLKSTTAKPLDSEVKGLKTRLYTLLTEITKKISIAEDSLREAETLIQKTKDTVNEIEKKKNSEGKDKKNDSGGIPLKTIISITIILCVVIIVIGAIVYFKMNRKPKYVEDEEEI